VVLTITSCSDFVLLAALRVERNLGLLTWWPIKNRVPAVANPGRNWVEDLVFMLFYTIIQRKNDAVFQVPGVIREISDYIIMFTSDHTSQVNDRLQTCEVRASTFVKGVLFRE